MRDDRLDCDWCGSARSIEYGICQICLMEYPLETKVIPLPIEAPWERNRKRLKRIDFVTTEQEVGIAE
jgi:hypothetical protein